MLSGCDGRAVKNFDPDGEAVPSARTFAREIAHVWGIESEDTAFLIGLVVSELATNAVVHAQTPFTVALAIENGAVTVEVTDDDPRLPSARDPSPMALKGRGLVIVDQVSRAWGVRPVPGGGKVVWAELPYPHLGPEELPSPAIRSGTSMNDAPTPIGGSSAPSSPTARTRISGAWIGLIIFAVVLVLLLVLIIQNTKSVEISYFTARGSMPLGVALLLAAIAGLLLAVAAASLRIWQLRHRLKRSGGADNSSRVESSADDGG